MANLQKTKSEALAIIDAALAILNKFPEIETANSTLSFNTSSNPFPFLMDCFKSTTGYNILINILSKFIMLGLPAVEIAVKGVLLANIKNILSCAINPFISDEILRNGIVFNLQQIDITDTLRYSPLDEIGKYYYFDNYKKSTVTDSTGKKKQIDIPKQVDDLKVSKDFNCLIWYMKHIASFREVWGQQPDATGGRTNVIENNDTYWNKKKNKCRKGAGIVTLEYNVRPEGLRNAEGYGMSSGDASYAGLQTPYGECLHVFLGNVKEKSNKEGNEQQDAYIEATKALMEANDKISIAEKAIEDIKKQQKKYEQDRKKGKITQEHYTVLIGDCCKQIENKKNEIKDLKDDIKTNKENKVNAIKELRKIQSQMTNNDYRKITQNYYYRRTLVEFNTDYVMSLKLFDSKVVTAQLLDSLMGLLNIDLNLTYKQMLIKNEVKKMVQMIVETDDTVVSDCFFTFTNDDYNAMLEKAELNRAKLFSINGEQNTTTTIDPKEILRSLNELDDSAIQSGDTTVIEHALTEISGNITTMDAMEGDAINFGARMNFIENLMNNLAYVITSAVLSPKVYLLILINLEILGKDTNFNLEGFIGQFKQLIASLIRTIRDQLIKYLVDELMKILGNIATEIAVKIGIEQAQYYYRLMKKIIDCFKRKGTTLDFTIDSVEHADIITEEQTPKNAEC